MTAARVCIVFLLSATVGAQTRSEYEALAQRLGGTPVEADQARLIEQNSPLVTSDLEQILRDQADHDYSTRDLPRAAALSQALWLAASRVGDRTQMAYAQRSIGRVRSAQGDFPKALEYFDRALLLYRELDDQSGVADVLNEQGIVYRFTSNPTLALQKHEEARRIYERLDDDLGLARTFMNLGQAYYTSDNYRNALEALQRSVEISEAEDFQSVMADATNSLGSLYYQQGNRELALEFYQRSLKIKEKTANYFEIINTLVNMSIVYTSLSRFDDARRNLDQALQLARPDDPRARAQVLNRYGRLLFAEGKFQEALDRLTETLKIFETVKDDLLKGDTLVRIGRAQVQTDRFSEAIKTADQALDIGVRAQSQILQVLALEVRGVAARALNQQEEALRSLLQSIDVHEQMRSNVVGGATQQQNFLRSEGDMMHGAAEALIELRRLGEAFQMAERNKGRALLTVLGGNDERLAKHLTIEERTRQDALQSQANYINSQLDQLQQNPRADQVRIQDLQESLRKARLELVAFESTLYAAHPELELQRNRTAPVSIEQAAALLPDSRTLLLEYEVGPETVYLFTLARNSQGKADLKVHKLGISKKDLTRRVTDFRNKIAARDLDFKDEAAKLYELLLAPAAPELAGKQTLVIAPDAALWQLPFQALQASADQALLEKYAMFFTPSMTVLSRMMAARPGNTNENPTLLAVGDPALGRELLELQDVYGAQNTRILAGADAGENVTRNVAARYSVLHFATHGYYDDNHPMYSYLQLSRDTADSSEDGRLEAREMMDLELNADVVVLSACETARGDASGGEGLIGMTWGLLVAGVPTTVASQWKVDSGSTAELMIGFHRLLYQRLTGVSRMQSKAKALQQAAIETMKNPGYRHPFYWAGFVMVGQGF